MNWFDRWLSKKVQQYWNAVQQDKIVGYASDLNVISTKGNRRAFEVQATLNFRLHHAENGWIVEVNNYDQRSDRHITKLHLIGNDEEFDQAICQIITLEALRG